MAKGFRLPNATIEAGDLIDCCRQDYNWHGQSSGPVTGVRLGPPSETRPRILGADGQRRQLAKSGGFINDELGKRVNFDSLRGRPRGEAGSPLEFSTALDAIRGIVTRPEGLTFHAIVLFVVVLAAALGCSRTVQQSGTAQRRRTL